MDTRISLLDEVNGGSEDAWTELSQLYKPLISAWLRKYDLQPDDADDLSQDVMTTLFRRVQEFDHNGRVGAFRNWLRTVTSSRANDFLRKRNRSASPPGGSSFQQMLNQLEDPESDVSVQFDREHDLHVLAQLLKRVRVEFQDSTMQIFRAHVMQGHPASSVADQFEVSRHAVYMAKSRILRRLREMAPDLIHDMEKHGSC